MGLTCFFWPVVSWGQTDFLVILRSEKVVSWFFRLGKACMLFFWALERLYPGFWAPKRLYPVFFVLLKGCILVFWALKRLYPGGNSRLGKGCILVFWQLQKGCILGAAGGRLVGALKENRWVFRPPQVQPLSLCEPLPRFPLGYCHNIQGKH